MSIRKILEKSKASNQLISIFLDEQDWSRCTVGYVDSLDDNSVRIKAIDKFGEPSGYEIRPINEISKIDSNGKYENKISILEKNNNIFNEFELKNEKNNDLILDTLKKAQSNKLIVVLWGNDPDDSLVGFVNAIDESTVNIQIIDEYGGLDGVSTIEIKAIRGLDFNTKREQVLKFLSDLGPSNS